MVNPDKIDEKDEDNVDGEPLEEEVHCVITNEDEMNVNATSSKITVKETQTKEKGGWKDVGAEPGLHSPKGIPDLSHLIDEELDGEPLTKEDLEGLIILPES